MKPQDYIADKVENQNQVAGSSPTYLVLCADDRYSMPLAVTIQSVVENFNNDKYLHIFVIDGGIKQKNKEKIKKKIESKAVSLEWLTPNPTIFKDIEVPKDYHLPLATCFRLLIPYILPSHLKKIIYLDCDLIVNTDLSLLWEIDIENNYLLATIDMGIPYVSSILNLKKYYEKLLEFQDRKYFNAGVLVINLEKWRNDTIPEKLVRCLREKKEYIQWFDQDALNIVIENGWQELDPRWNQQPAIYTYELNKTQCPFPSEVREEIMREPYIIHFIHYKPWSSNVPHPFRDRFYKYLDKTAWSGYRYRFHKYLWDTAVWKWKKIVKAVR